MRTPSEQPPEGRVERLGASETHDRLAAKQLDARAQVRDDTGRALAANACVNICANIPAQDAQVGRAGCSEHRRGLSTRG